MDFSFQFLMNKYNFPWYILLNDLFSIERYAAQMLMTAVSTRTRKPAEFLKSLYLSLFSEKIVLMYHCFHPSYFICSAIVDQPFGVLHQGMQTKHLYPKADKRPRVKLLNPQIANKHCSKWPIRNKTDLHRWKPVSEDYFAKETISIVKFTPHFRCPVSQLSGCIMIFSKWKSRNSDIIIYFLVKEGK